jgi:hypothetical protein
MHIKPLLAGRKAAPENSLSHGRNYQSTKLAHSIPALALQHTSQKDDTSISMDYISQSTEMSSIGSAAHSKVISESVAPHPRRLVRIKGKNDMLALNLDAPLLLDPDSRQLPVKLRGHAIPMSIRNAKLYRRHHPHSIDVRQFTPHFSLSRKYTPRLHIRIAEDLRLHSQARPITNIHDESK